MAEITKARPQNLNELGLQDALVDAGYTNVSIGANIRIRGVTDDQSTNDAIDAIIAAHNPNVLTDAQQAEIVQAASDSQAASIPAWASWSEAAALAWHDTNITNELPVANLTEANALLQTMATENRNMIRMIIAMRNKLWPNLEDSS